MTVYLATIHKHGSVAPDGLPPDLADFLPLEPQTTEQRRVGACGLLAFRWGAALDRAILDAPEGAALLVGNPVFPAGEGPASVFTDDLAALNARLRGGYSGVVVRPDRVDAFASLSADFPLFVRETDELVCVSNRFALLLAVGPEPELDHAALASIVSNGYVYGPRTTHRGIVRVGPGEVVRATAHGFRIEKPSLHGLFAPVDPRGALPLIRAGIESARAELASVDVADGATLPLSGGKDSRAIAGMLHAAGTLGRCAAYTNGHLYAPDVMAATGVAKALGVAHEVRRPPAITSGIDVIARISATLLALQGQVSLFDHVGTGRFRGVSIGGHQIGLRDSYFQGERLRSGTADDVAERLAREVHLDGHGLLSPGAREAIRLNLVAVCDDLLGRGVPVEKAPTAFMWAVRLFGWLTVVNGAANVAGSTVNPLLNIDLMRAAFALPDEVVSAEVVHFIMMRETAPGLADLPFAQQRWSPALGAALKRLRWKGAAPQHPAEYRTSLHLPTAANPYLPNVKVAAYKVLSRFTLAEIDGLDAPWLDAESVKIVCRPDAPQTLSRGISQSGVFTGVLWARYGRDLVRRSAQERITADLSAFVSPDDTPDAPTHAEQLRLLTRSLEDHEAALAKFLASERDARQAEPERPPGPKKQLRHVDIVNRSAEPVDVWFDYGLGRQSGKITVDAGETCSYGLYDTGAFKLRARSASLDETHRIAVRADRSTYTVRVGAGCAAMATGR